jgi:predicted HicB family RNase H-like nuclease
MTSPSRTPVLIRFDTELLARIDERRHAANTTANTAAPLSRNAWVEKALSWALEQPLTARPESVVL